MDITDWDQAYQDNFTPWDKGAPSPPLVEWLSRNPLPGRVLVPGCGLGHDVAYLASIGIDAYGLDISPTAVERARIAHPGHAGRFIHADLFEYLPDQPFDAIVEHTCLCALPPDWRPRYRDAVARLLRPGGLLVGIFYANPDMDPGETGPPFGITADELADLFAPHFEVVESHVPAAAYPGREGRELLRILRRRP